MVIIMKSARIIMLLDLNISFLNTTINRIKYRTGIDLLEPFIPRALPGQQIFFRESFLLILLNLKYA